MRGHGSQWFSHKMNNRHPLQLKKSKSWEPFGSYQLNSTANPAHLPQNRPNFEVNGLDWQCCLAGSSQRAPRILIFSIVLGAKCLSYLKSIETHARARLISDGISGVLCHICFQDFLFRQLKILDTFSQQAEFQMYFLLKMAKKRGFKPNPNLNYKKLGNSNISSL